MFAVRVYFQQHRWQRRAVSLLLAAVAGLALGRYALYPAWRNSRLLAGLTAADPVARREAIIKAASVAYQDEGFRRYLIKSLDTPDDIQFESVADVLDLLGIFSPSLRDPHHVFRRRRLAYSSLLPASPMPTTAASTQEHPDPNGQLRARIVGEFVRGHYTGDEATKLLAAILRDPDPGARSEAAVLAVMCRDDPAAKALLNDHDPEVRSRAMIALALAGRADLLNYDSIIEDLPIPGGLPTGSVRTRLELAIRYSDDEDELAAAGLALALVDPGRASANIAACLSATKSPIPRDRLYWAACLIPPDHFDGKDPRWLEDLGDSPMPYLLVGRQRFGTNVVPEALAGPWNKDELTRGDADKLAAAAWSARQLDLPVFAEIDRMMWELFHPGIEFTMMQSALTLAHAVRVQAELDPVSADEARSQAVKTLLVASGSDAAPMAAAAAAYALWEVDHNSGEAAMFLAAGARTTLAGDWLAWRLAHADAAAAREMGEQLLNARYNTNARGAGAMMLALACRGDPAAAAEAQREIAAKIGPEDDPLVRDAVLLDSYRCALLLLGRADLLSHVRDLTLATEFPQRRLMTALLLAGDRQDFDWLLANSQIDAAQLEFLLGGKMICEILAVARPDLPAFEPLASPSVRRWQAQIILDAYALCPTKP